MKKKILFIFILTVISLLFVSTNKVRSEDVNTNNISPTSLVSDYYNDGVYTKKTEMYLTEDAIIEFKEHFHVNATVDRTTYYNGDYLLMGDFDGGFDEVNSGFRTDGTDMKHFIYQNGEVVDDYTVVGTNIHDYFVMLDDMMESGYFDNFTKVSNSKYTYLITTTPNGIDEKLHDFLS